MEVQDAERGPPAASGPAPRGGLIPAPRGLALPAWVCLSVCLPVSVWPVHKLQDLVPEACPFSATTSHPPRTHRLPNRPAQAPQPQPGPAGRKLPRPAGRVRGRCGLRRTEPHSALTVARLQPKGRTEPQTFKEFGWFSHAPVAHATRSAHPPAGIPLSESRGEFTPEPQPRSPAGAPRSQALDVFKAAFHLPPGGSWTFASSRCF